MVDKVDVHALRQKRLDLDPDDIVAAAVKATAAMRVDDAHATCAVSSVLNSLIRTIVTSERGVSILDYGAVEARGIAWVADCELLLTAFRDTSRDVYKEYAKLMYGYDVDKDSFERFVAKQIILGCGYGMSAGGFKRSFERFLTVHIGKKVGRAISDEEADKFVGLYRNTYKEIPAVWHAYNDAAKRAVFGAPTFAGKCEFAMDGKDLTIKLPSGRKIYYRNARIQDVIPGWAKLKGQYILIPTICFDHPHGYMGTLYGGRIAENIVQGVARDLLAWALVIFEQASLMPFIHVHDEAGCETRDLALMAQLMSDPPSWAKGFPVLVEGYSGDYWTKQYKTFRQIKALNGVIL
jgi:DNA polymerase